MDPEIKKIPQTKEIVVDKGFKGTLKTYLQLQWNFTQNIEFPISRSNIPETAKKEKISVLGKIDAVCGGITLLNFTLKSSEINGVKIFQIQNRECKISFGVRILNGSKKILSNQRYFEYSISENLSVKRSIEVYNFFLNLFQGKELSFGIGELSSSVDLPNKIEKFKIQKILEILNKYNFICNKEKVSSNEKVTKLLKKAYEVDLIFHTIMGKSIETKLNLNMEEGNFIEGDFVNMTRNSKTRIKGLNFVITEFIHMKEAVSENELIEGKVSVFGKSAEISFKKNS